MRFLHFIAISLSVSIIAISCSGSTNPTTPDQSASDIKVSEAGLTDTRGVFGAWKVILDPETLDAEIVPARNAQAIGDFYDADLSQFLDVSPCANCMRITNVMMDTEHYIRMTVGIRHPFANLTARPDLHGFDVRLIFIAGTSSRTYPDIPIMLPDGTEVAAELTETRIYNADGFTSHFDSIVTDDRYFQNGSDIPGNLNPFLRYFDDYGTGTFDPNAPAGHNVMPVGSDFQTRTVIIRPWMDDPMAFFLVADVAYGQSAVLANRHSPQYYLPAFNRTEPWRVEYWIENNNLDSADPTSTVDVMVQVFDWQQGATVDTSYPNPANLVGIPESSNVLSVTLSAESLQNDPVTVTTPLYGSGTPSDPLTYRLTLTNENMTTYIGEALLVVRDELYGQAAPSGRIPIPVSPAGFPYDTEDIRDYSIYQSVSINYPWPSAMWNSELSMDPDDRVKGYTDITLAPTFFMDPSGTRFQYRWDYDYDGITFDVDGGGYPHRINFPQPGKHDVGLRIRTNSVPAREYIYEIPIWAGGNVFDSVIDSSPTDSRDQISYTRSDSVAMSSDYYYCAFTSEAGSHRNVWLAVGDQTGNFTAQSIGSPTGACFNPVIGVIENGTHDRVIVVYNQFDTSDNGWDLYATWGNLDGTGFDVAHQIQIPATLKFSVYPEIITRPDRVLIYYTSTSNPFVSNYIEVAYTDDYGATWNVHPTRVDSGSTSKWQTAAVYVSSSYRVHLIWEDYRDSATNGTDLYRAISYGGLDFDAAERISSFAGSVNELDPEAASNHGTVSIIYKADPTTSGDYELWIKMYNVYHNSVLNYQITNGLYVGEPYRPSIAMGRSNLMAVSYAVYDDATDDLRHYNLMLEENNGIFDIYTTQITSDLIGNVSAAVIDGYPGSSVACRDILNGEAFECFFVWMDYTNGAYPDPTPFQTEFGDLNTYSMIETL